MNFPSDLIWSDLINPGEEGDSKYVMLYVKVFNEAH